MIYYLLLAVSIVLCVCKSSVYNAYAKKSPAGLSTVFRFNAMTYGIAAAVALLLFLLGSKTVSPSTLLCALLYAVIVTSLQTLSVMAMKVGAMSLTAICVMYGMMIPALAGPIFWRERLGYLQIAGILVMAVSLWLLKEKPSAQNKTSQKKWLPLAFLCFLLSGMAGVAEKIHQSTPGKEEKEVFVFSACLFMLLFSLIATLLTRKKGEAEKPNRSLLLLGVLSGLIVGFYSMVNLTLAGELDSMIYFPVANGGAMLLTVLVSVIAFKERFDKSRIAGVIIGLVGILCLSLPI